MRWTGLILTWLAYNLGIGTVYWLYRKTNDYRVIVGGILFLGQFTALLTAVAVFRPRLRTTVTVGLVAALLACGLNDANAQEDVQKPPASEPRPQLLAVCIAVGVVIGIGIGGGYIIWRLCKLLPRPVNPPAPPPITTNAPPPIGTNAPPSSNSVSSVSFWQPLSSTPGVAVNVTETGAYDISYKGWDDTNGPVSSKFFILMTASVTNIQSSDDLLNWSDCTITAWVSATGVESILYDGQGSPIFTNYAPGNAEDLRNPPQLALPFGVWLNDAHEPKRFYRLANQ